MPICSMSVPSIDRRRQGNSCGSFLVARRGQSCVGAECAVGMDDRNVHSMCLLVFRDGCVLPVRAGQCAWSALLLPSPRSFPITCSLPRSVPSRLRVFAGLVVVRVIICRSTLRWGRAPGPIPARIRVPLPCCLWCVCPVGLLVSVSGDTV